MADNQGEVRELPVEYYGFYDIPATYSDLAVVSNTPNEFTLYFFHGELPFYTAAEQIKPGDKARAKCVARIVIPYSAMESLVGALQTNLGRFKAAVQQAQKEKKQ